MGYMVYSQLINPSMAIYQCYTKLGSDYRQSHLARLHVEEECPTKYMRGALTGPTLMKVNWHIDLTGYIFSLKWPTKVRPF